ncbi:peptidase M16 inactive domain protein [Clostridium homopropionicum DSM 5847]|uniref:Peptidase M16 inactive domain protein n=1 Tax=Clostridium homopropionicum DSM 5847 TaxID=1121318 RepID=A0A0L6ZCC7_9CLOT|nr:pitrilysin family protein [Clostridium homopropionicum]KOA20453.1 peptidase M16 inactive domain protein [Clostridium homopropionicum DSM 5847]SFG35440.1 Predicted Zn-dependent peptidase [Clostridium homopropionicum]
MIKHILKNGIKLNYIKKEGKLTSFCIGFNAGAIMEKKYETGLAHVVEHMLFKGTKKRSEKEINEACDEVFGFHNAMTNYPYVIYYGTTLSDEFKKGFEIYSDILLNPTFPLEGYKEEINIILEELKEWKDDPYQECEDELFFNTFKQRRIKDLIIGSKESINKITIEQISDFYKKHYVPSNCVISVVSSLDFKEVLDQVELLWGNWHEEYSFIENDLYENNNEGIYYKNRKDLKSAKIQYCYTIDSLNQYEMKILKIFNERFGNGTSSILYDEVRTKNGLAYEIESNIKEEKGIKLFTIKVGTSVENIDKVIDLINNNINFILNNKVIFNESDIRKIVKSINLKKELSLEKSIELCKKLTTYELMFNSTEDLFNEFPEEFIASIDENKIIKVVEKVLRSPSIQILRP